MHARTEFIRRVTDADVTAWRYMQVNGQITNEFLLCVSNDGVDGTFITAHINDVYKLSLLNQVRSSALVVANTCIWSRLSHKKLLYSMMHTNRAIKLWFAMQELSIDIN